jgi:flagellar protein FlbD
VIWVTRLNGSEIVVNADLVETVESTPDTVITLVDGKKYVVHEGPQEVIDRVCTFRATILLAADQIAPAPPATQAQAAPTASIYMLPSGEDR